MRIKAAAESRVLVTVVVVTVLLKSVVIVSCSLSASVILVQRRICVTESKV